MRRNLVPLVPRLHGALDRRVEVIGRLLLGRIEQAACEFDRRLRVVA